MSKQDCYIPGRVNIGSVERNKRIRNGWLYLVITLILSVFFIYWDISRNIRMLIYLPATMSALGFLQARSSFCVYYGLKKEIHMDEEEKKVDDQEANFLDRKTSINILIVSMSIGLAYTIIIYLI